MCVGDILHSVQDICRNNASSSFPLHWKYPSVPYSAEFASWTEERECLTTKEDQHNRLLDTPSSNSWMQIDTTTGIFLQSNSDGLLSRNQVKKIGPLILSWHESKWISMTSHATYVSISKLQHCKNSLASHVSPTELSEYQLISQ